MSGQDAAGMAGRIIERWGFPVLVALAAGWVLRNDVLVPLVDEHRQFVRELSETQRELSGAMREQTRLLYALQPRTADWSPHGDTPQN